MISDNDITRNNRCAFAEPAGIALRSLTAFLTRGTYGLVRQCWRVMFADSECSPPFRRRRRNVGLGVCGRHAQALESGSDAPPPLVSISGVILYAARCCFPYARRDRSGIAI